MKFYTNVQLIGNQFLVRGVENGRRYEHRDEFFPTLFVKSKKKTKYKTLNGEAAVSYTHLTLPTNREVQISVVAVSLKKMYLEEVVGNGQDNQDSVPSEPSDSDQ